MNKDKDLSQGLLGFLIGIGMTCLIMILGYYTLNAENNNSSLREIVESRYCLANTSLQIHDYGNKYINCCRIEDNDPPIQNYIRDNFTVNIIQCVDSS